MSSRMAASSSTTRMVVVLWLVTGVLRTGWRLSRLEDGKASWSFGTERCERCRSRHPGVSFYLHSNAHAVHEGIRRSPRHSDSTYNEGEPNARAAHSALRRAHGRAP